MNERVEEVVQEQENFNVDEIIDVPEKKEKKKLFGKKELSDKSFGEIFDELSRTDKFSDKFSLLWNCKKTNAAMKLFLYFIFFAIIAILFNGITPAEYNKDQTDDALKNYDNFSYITNITYRNNKIMTLSGNYYKGKSKLSINDQMYFYENQNLYRIVNNYLETTDFKIIPELQNLFPANISELLSIAEEDTTTKDKENNIIEKTYQIGLNELRKKILNEDTDESGQIPIIVRYNDNKIHQVKLSFTYANIDENSVMSILITYHNFGNVSDTDMSYSIAPNNSIEGE